MRLFRMFVVACLLATFSGCAGFGIVATTDPLTKLNDAEDLFMRQDRPLPAERLIREAVAIYQERDDAHGLANAYREYGDFLRSMAVLKWEKVYRRDGFQDKSITFDSRIEKASEFYRQALVYYDRAEKEHQASGKYDALTNIYFNMAWVNYRIIEREKACRYYGLAVEAYEENIRRNPSAKPYTPPKSGSFSQFINTQKARVGC